MSRRPKAMSNYVIVVCKQIADEPSSPEDRARFNLGKGHEMRFATSHTNTEEALDEFLSATPISNLEDYEIQFKLADLELVREVVAARLALWDAVTELEAHLGLELVNMDESLSDFAACVSDPAKIEQTSLTDLLGTWLGEAERL